MNHSLPSSLPGLAERVRFELTDTRVSAVFKTEAGPHDPPANPSLTFTEGSREPVTRPAVSGHSLPLSLPARLVRLWEAALTALYLAAALFAIAVFLYLVARTVGAL